MPITKDDLKRQIEVHSQVQEALTFGKYRKAAELLCEEFKRLAGMDSYWRDIGAALPKISKNHQVEGQKLLEQLIPLIHLESEVFRRLEIDEKKSNPVLANVYGSLDRAIVKEGSKPSQDALLTLQRDLRVAAGLICAESKGTFQKACDFIMSWKGVRVLAGSATMTANVLIFAIDGGAISWTSLHAGMVVMQGNVKDLIDVLKDRKDS